MHLSGRWDEICACNYCEPIAGLAGWICLSVCPEDGHSLSYGNVTANTRFDGEIGVDNDAGCSLIVVGASGGQGRKLSSKNSTDDHPRRGMKFEGLICKLELRPCAIERKSDFLRVRSTKSNRFGVHNLYICLSVREPVWTS